MVHYWRREIVECIASRLIRRSTRGLKFRRCLRQIVECVGHYWLGSHPYFALKSGSREGFCWSRSVADLGVVYCAA